MSAYDPTNGVWQLQQPVFDDISHFEPVIYGNGLVYIILAMTGPFPDETPIPNVLIYDARNGVLINSTTIPQERRRGGSAVVTYNEKIYGISGILKGHRSGTVAWFDEYEPLNGTWATLADAPIARDHCQGTILGDELYVAGGRISAFPRKFEVTVETVDVYSFVSATWRSLDEPLPTPRGAAAVVAFNGLLVVIGGESEQAEAHDETEAYDPSTGSWLTLGKLQTGRHGTTAFVYNGAIYISGGAGLRGGKPELSSIEVLA